MRKTLLTVVMAAGFMALAAAPAFADTVTRTLVGNKNTLTCTITYAESSVPSNGRIDTLKELLSITNISCTVARN